MLNVLHASGVPMKKKIVVILLSVIILAAVIIITGRILLSMQFTGQVKNLFSNSRESGSKVFSYRQLDGLPAPVQRYFRHVLKEGRQYTASARVRHAGWFKTGLDKDWIAITGEQYYTVDKPGFIWKGETSMFTARDMYINDKGSLEVQLFSLFTIVNAQGPAYDQGELLRWLGECVWFPSALLPSEYISWTAVDSSTAMLNMNYNGISVFYKVTFNKNNEITKLETRRYMDGNRLETWIGTPSDYREINGTVIPVKIEGAWSLDSGYFAYARFILEEIDYNRPERF
jgi:hypothetical protein